MQKQIFSAFGLLSLTALLSGCGFDCTMSSAPALKVPLYASEIRDSPPGGMWLLVADELPSEIVATDDTMINEVMLHASPLVPPYYRVDVPEDLLPGSTLVFDSQILTVSEEELETPTGAPQLIGDDSVVSVCSGSCKYQPIDFTPGQTCGELEAFTVSTSDSRYDFLVVSIWEGEEESLLSEENVVVPAALATDFSLQENGFTIRKRDQALVMRVLDARFPDDESWLFIEATED